MIKGFDIDYGAYRHVSGSMAVVITVVTNPIKDGALIESEPMVVYRDLEFKMEKHVVYLMNLSEFKEKFKRE